MGPIAFGKKQEQVFLGRDISRDRNYGRKWLIPLTRKFAR